jgi:hypothetical protein
MPHATHRANTDSGLALLVRTTRTRKGPAGQHRQVLYGVPARARRARPEPGRGPQLLTRGLAGLILLALTGLIGFLVLANERRGDPADSGTAAAAPPDLLASQVTDPAPLSLQGVFANPQEVRVPGAAGPYQIDMTHIDNQCGIATTGSLGLLLQERGCTQVVRAGLTAPYGGGYRVTVGLFNLADSGGAEEVDGRLRRLVETGDGSFAAMTAGLPGADSSAPPSSQVGWHARGHYLLYCVIAAPDGGLLPGDDPYAERITAEMIDSYLTESVLGPRASRT